LNAQTVRRGSPPFRPAEQNASTRRGIQSDQLSLGVRLIDVLDPVAGRNGLPIGKSDEAAWSDALQARPTQVLGSTDQARAERIPLDISADRQKIVVIGDREGLELPRGERAGIQGTIGVVPPHHMDHRQPVHEDPDISIGQRPEHEMPMVRDQSERRQTFPTKA